MNFDFDSEETKSNYPIGIDTEFTPDEIEAIKEYKNQLSKKRDKNRAILRGIEQAFWGVSSYSMIRFIIINAGLNGLPLAITASLLINNIVNRDCLDGFNMNRSDGQFEVNGMGNLFKFAFSSIVAGVIFFNAVGDLIHLKNNSEATYQTLTEAVEEFNGMPQNYQNIIMIIAGVFVIGGVLVIVERGRR